MKSARPETKILPSNMFLYRPTQRYSNHGEQRKNARP